MIGTPPSQRPMWHDPMAHARHFANEYADRLEHYVEGRMHALDIPEEQMGLPDLSRGILWAVFHPNGMTGGTIIGEKFAVNSGVLNPDLLTERYGPDLGTRWARSRLRDRYRCRHRPRTGGGTDRDTRRGRGPGRRYGSGGIRRGAADSHGHGRERPVIHNLTAGHFDRAGLVSRPLDMGIVRSLLAELGDVDADGEPTLGGWKVRFEDGCVILPWKGGTTNRTAEAFAVRLHQATGCTLADREHGRVVEAEHLAAPAPLAG